MRSTSTLDADDFDRRLRERRPRFRAVPGLVQKLSGRDPATGADCGIYFFESQQALAAFRETELAATIPSAYAAIDVRREVLAADGRCGMPGVARGGRVRRAVKARPAARSASGQRAPSILRRVKRDR